MAINVFTSLGNSDVTGKFSGIATLDSESTVDTAEKGDRSKKVANTEFVANEVAAIVDSAPEALDTLVELSTALGNDPNFATTVATELGSKVKYIIDRGNGSIYFSRDIYIPTEYKVLEGENDPSTCVSSINGKSREDASSVHNISVAGTVLTFTKADGTDTSIELQDKDTLYSEMVGSTESTDGYKGLVPTPFKGIQNRYLRADGTWSTPPDTKYDELVGATVNTNGASGLVPAPEAGKESAYLRGDGTWTVPTNTTYSEATDDSSGLLSKEDKVKLDNIEDNATNVTETTVSDWGFTKSPTITETTVSGWGFTKSPTITKETVQGWGFQTENTTYNNATTKVAGLMSTTDKSKLDLYPSERFTWGNLYNLSNN